MHSDLSETIRHNRLTFDAAREIIHTILGQRAKNMATRCLEHSAKQLETTMTPIISLPFESCLV